MYRRKRIAGEFWNKINHFGVLLYMLIIPICFAGCILKYSAMQTTAIYIQYKMLNCKIDRAN
jgi:hypothetical protein